MFSCFSKQKKKKEISAPTDHTQISPNRKIQTFGSKRCLKRTNHQKKARIVNFVEPKQTSLTNQCQFEKIDQLLSEEEQSKQNGNILTKSQNQGNPLHQKEKNQKFKDINPSNNYNISVTPITNGDEFSFFQKKKWYQDSQEGEITAVQLEFTKTPSVQENDPGAMKNENEVSNNNDSFKKSQESPVIYQPGEEEALQTSITLNNFKERLSRMPSKMAEEQQDNQTFQQAQNSFYCCECDLNEQFSRSVVAGALSLAQSLFSKMNQQQRNRKDRKGYTPVQVIVRKGLADPKFLQFAKTVLHDQNVSLECRGPNGWTPLQDAILHRNIPLTTHLFKEGYLKRQKLFAKTIKSVETLLLNMPDFELEIDVKVDSFLPLVGALAPNDIVKICKVGGRVAVSYSLVGYQFPVCKRRDMGVVVGDGLWGVNRSKGWYCDLLQELDQQEMILLVEDLLQREVRRGEPIVHQFALKKCKSLFDNDIIQQFCGSKSAKYLIELVYTSTAGKRQSGAQSKQDLTFLSDYSKYRERTQIIEVKEKNKNKKVEIEVWLAEGFGLQLNSFLSVVDLLGVGNTLLGKWSAFIKQNLLPLTKSHQLFPVKINLPLNYSLYFDIEFKNFKFLEEVERIEVDQDLKRVKRKDFQGVVDSRQKRSLLLQAFT